MIMMSDSITTPRQPLLSLTAHAPRPSQHVGARKKDQCTPTPPPPFLAVTTQEKGGGGGVTQ